jgi:hypothetical protein
MWQVEGGLAPLIQHLSTVPIHHGHGLLRNRCLEKSQENVDYTQCT